MYEMVLEGEKHVSQAKDNLVTIHINNMDINIVFVMNKNIRNTCSMQLCRLQVLKGSKL